jgi:hypothetical protein
MAVRMRRGCGSGGRNRSKLSRRDLSFGGGGGSGRICVRGCDGRRHDGGSDREMLERASLRDGVHSPVWREGQEGKENEKGRECGNNRRKCAMVLAEDACLTAGPQMKERRAAVGAYV